MKRYSLTQLNTASSTIWRGSFAMYNGAAMVAGIAGNGVSDFS